MQFFECFKKILYFIRFCWLLFIEREKTPGADFVISRFYKLKYEYSPKS